MKTFKQKLALLLMVAAVAFSANAQGHYQSFIVSTYMIQGTVQSMMSGDQDLPQIWSNLTRNLKIDKIYLEVMRNHTLVAEAGLEKLKKFFQDQGVQVCGGLAYSVSEANGYQSFDYADPENRAFARKVMEMAARHFDEILLDDYYSFDRKADYDIKAKGDQSWTQYRLQTMREVTENLIVKPAIPELKYANLLTHDAWGDALGISPGGTTYPIVLSCDYWKGKCYVLTIPNDPADLYMFPPAVLSVIRAALAKAEPVRIDCAPARVALFRYDNNTFIVQYFLATEAEVTVSVAGIAKEIRDLLTGKIFFPSMEPEPVFGSGGFGGRGPAAPPKRSTFKFTVPPHSYLACLSSINAQPSP